MYYCHYRWYTIATVIVELFSFNFSRINRDWCHWFQTPSLSFATPSLGVAGLGGLGSFGALAGGLGGALGGVGGLGGGFDFGLGGGLGSGLGAGGGFLPDVGLPVAARPPLLPFAASGGLGGSLGGLSFGGGLGGFGSGSLGLTSQGSSVSGLSLGGLGGGAGGLGAPRIPSVATVLKEGPDAFVAAGAAPKGNRFDVLRQLASNPYQSAFKASIGDPSLSPLPLPKDPEAKFQQLAKEVSKDLEAGDSSLTSQQQTTKAIYESIEGVVGRDSPHPTPASQHLPPTVSPQSVEPLTLSTLEVADPPARPLSFQASGVHVTPTPPSPPAHVPTPSGTGEEERHRHTFVSQDGFPIDERSRLTPFKAGSSKVPKVTSALPEPKDQLPYPKSSPAQPLAVLPPPDSHVKNVKGVHDPPQIEHQGRFDGPPSRGRPQGEFSHAPPPRKPPTASSYLRFEKRPVPAERPRLKDPSLPGRRHPGASKRPPPLGIPDTSEDFPGRSEGPPVPLRRPRPLLSSRGKESVQHRPRLRPQSLYHTKHSSNSFPEENTHPQGQSELALTTLGPPRANSDLSPRPSQPPVTHDPVLDLFRDKRPLPEHEIRAASDEASQKGFRSKLRPMPPPPPYVKEVLIEPISPSTRPTSSDVASEVLQEFGLRPLPPPPKIEPPKLLSSEQILSFVESQNPNPRPKIDFDIGSSSKDESVLPPDSELKKHSATRPQSPESSSEERGLLDGTSLPELLPPDHALLSNNGRTVVARMESEKSPENLPVLLPSPPPFVEFPGITTNRKAGSLEVSQSNHNTVVDATTAEPGQSVSKLKVVNLPKSQPDLHQHLPPSHIPPGEEAITPGENLEHRNSGVAYSEQISGENYSEVHRDSPLNEERKASLNSFQNDESLHNEHQNSRQPLQQGQLIENSSWQGLDEQRNPYHEDGDAQRDTNLNEHNQRSPSSEGLTTQPKFQQPGDVFQQQKDSQRNFRQFGNRFPQQPLNGHQGVPHRQEFDSSIGQLQENKFHRDIHRHETEIQNSNGHGNGFHRDPPQENVFQTSPKDRRVNFQINSEQETNTQPSLPHGKPSQASRRDKDLPARHRGQSFRENKVMHQGLQIIDPSEEKGIPRHPFTRPQNPSSQIPATPLKHLRPPTRSQPHFMLRVLTTPPRPSQRRPPLQKLYRGSLSQPRPAFRSPHSGRQQPRFSASYSDPTTHADGLRRPPQRPERRPLSREGAKTSFQSHVPRTITDPVELRHQRTMKRPSHAPTTGSPKDLLSSGILQDFELLHSPDSAQKVTKESLRQPEESLKPSHSLIRFHFETPSHPDGDILSPDNKGLVSIGSKQEENIPASEIQDQLDQAIQEEHTGSNNQINQDYSYSSDSLSFPEIDDLLALSLFSPLSTSLSSSLASPETQDIDPHNNAPIEPVSSYEALSPDTRTNSTLHQTLPMVLHEETLHLSLKITPPPLLEALSSQPPHQPHDTSPTQLPLPPSWLSQPPSAPSVSPPGTSPPSVQPSQSPEAVTSTSAPSLRKGADFLAAASSPPETTTLESSFSAPMPLHKLLSDSETKRIPVSPRTEAPWPVSPSRSTTEAPSLSPSPRASLPAPETLVSDAEDQEDHTPLPHTTTSSPLLSLPSPSPLPSPSYESPAGSPLLPSGASETQNPTTAPSPSTSRPPPSSTRPPTGTTTPPEPQVAIRTAIQPDIRTTIQPPQRETEAEPSDFRSGSVSEKGDSSGRESQEQSREYPSLNASPPPPVTPPPLRISTPRGESPSEGNEDEHRLRKLAGFEQRRTRR
ncbi:serine/arginine repetitive matrix protein 2-like [Penaeus vannamei]|uniref:serine/arginine repetitive matrix protein 2-like n=1 Tax=Penaeus vannamei TaxID=6689 RepID=UPI00387F9F98